MTICRQGGLERATIWVIGIMTNKAAVYLFDYFFYPVIIWKCGILKGGVVMMLASFIVCWLTLIFYDWSKMDWLGIETIKSLKEYQGGKSVGRVMAWITKKGDPFALVALSVCFDPFITTAYMRSGAYQYNGLNRRDWTIFGFSLIIGNVYWTVVAYTGINLLEWILKNVSNWISR